MTQIIRASPSVRDTETYQVIGAAMEVHRNLGATFLEPVYHQALAVEFSLRNIPFEREVAFRVHYKGVCLARHYRVDFLCFRQVLVELKATERLGPHDVSQLINYLAVSRMGRGLLLNFGSLQLEYRRFVHSGIDP